MSYILSLPQELVDRIVEEFTYQHPAVDQEAHRALLACTLVNKSFSAPALRFLSSKIAIYDDNSKNTSLALELQSSLVIGNHLRSLCIHLSSPTEQSKEVEKALVFLVANPVKLERLDILVDTEFARYQPLFTKFNEGFRNPILQVRDSSNIRMLRLKFICMPLHEIAKFEGLQTLVLDRCTFSIDSSLHGKSPNFKALMALETLQVNRCITNFLDTLAYSVPTGRGRKNLFPNLKAFHCIINEHASLTYIWKFLREFHAEMNLETLDLVEEITDHDHIVPMRTACAATESDMQELDSDEESSDDEEDIDSDEEESDHDDLWYVHRAISYIEHGKIEHRKIEPGKPVKDVSRHHSLNRAESDLTKLMKLTHLKIQCVIPQDRKHFRGMTLTKILLPPSLTCFANIKTLHISLHLPYPLTGRLRELLVGHDEWKNLDKILSDPLLYPLVRTFRISLLMKASAEDYDDAMEDLQRFSQNSAFQFPLLRGSRSIIPNIDAVVMEDVHAAVPSAPELDAQLNADFTAQRAANVRARLRFFAAFSAANTNIDE
ncbi:hypothetical protein CPB84DRAFT_1824502 [Gymnopilus junonius]|uniref:Uncharacterized protein n=1 Tax=Gymnopilus junonius TaxID=109634 RepID=A0A9P5NR38_GYMJU|nr:hypothetical protein CPB84DRAFT_1824502 [Gymnopilus junonius]